MIQTQEQKAGHETQNLRDWRTGRVCDIELKQLNLELREEPGLKHCSRSEVLIRWSLTGMQESGNDVQQDTHTQTTNGHKQYTLMGGEWRRVEAQP